MRTKLIAIGVFGAALAIAIVVAIAGGGDDGGSPGTASADLTKPEVEVPDGPPPADLQITDVTEGDGAEVQAGDTLTMQYVGVDYATGKEFDSSWDAGQPFTFQLGSGEVIPGWDQGLEGMKVGGRRELVIPPDLAYGKAGQPPTIKPNETLVFVVDLLDAEPAS